MPKCGSGLSTVEVLFSKLAGVILRENSSNAVEKLRNTAAC
jgi:hypothetical protein